LYSEGSDGEMPPYGKEQEEYEDMLAENMDFSEEEDAEEMGGMTIRNAAQYAAYIPPKKKKKGNVSNDLRETSGYFDTYLRKGPKKEKWENLVNHKKELMTNFEKKYGTKNRNSQFMD